MPLVSAGVWFDADTGDARTPARSRHNAEGFGDPTAATFTPGPLPANYPSWDVPQTGRLYRRPWLPAPVLDDQYWPQLASVAQSLAWEGHQRPLPPRRPWRAAAEVPSLVPAPPDAVPLAWQGQETARRSNPRFRATDQFAFVEDASSATLGLAWLNSPEAARARRLWRPTDNAVSPAPIAPPSGDFPGYVGWRDDAPPMRRHITPWRAQDVPGLPPLVFVDVAAWCAALQPIADPPHRAARAKAVEQTGLPPLSVSLDVPAWCAALQSVAPPRRVVRLPILVYSDATAANWWAHQISIGAKWGPWSDQAPTLLRPRRLAPLSESSGFVLDVSQTAFWIQTDGGDRAQGSRPPWRPFTPEYAAPPWIGAGVIQVGGPFYLIAGQTYCAGAVAGSVDSL